VEGSVAAGAMQSSPWDLLRAASDVLVWCQVAVRSELWWQQARRPTAVAGPTMSDGMVEQTDGMVGWWSA
jgi:hypothetical protein